MSTKEIRKKLSEYIQVADDKKVKAIFTMVENDIESNTDIWTAEFLKEMEKRAKDFETGKDPGLSWQQVKQRVRKSSKSR